MDNGQQNQFARIAGEQVRFHCPLAPYTTFRVGGSVEALWDVPRPEPLLKVLPFLCGEGIPYFVLGRGSNLLISDGDIEGVAVRLVGSLALIEEDPVEDTVINAGAGAPIAELLDCCRKSGYGGLEFLSGIPGSVGGAAVMNAGAFGKDTASVIHGIEMITSAGQLLAVSRDELAYGYRRFGLKHGAVVTRVSICIERETPRDVANRIAGYLKRRTKTQPLEYPSAGSIFKNPPGDYAGRLIEMAGLKGMRRGGAMISDKHANWIVNTGDASSGDILELIRLTQKTVREKTGVALELEVRLIGL